ncbi:MAG: hypothetical protein ACTSWY_05010 [Promethearchaeota archaeon]
MIFPFFFEKLEEIGSYYNAFFRLKVYMLKYGLIEFLNSRSKEKTIRLTKKGIKIVRILKQIDDLLSLPFIKYRDKMKKEKKRNTARKRSYSKRK